MGSEDVSHPFHEERTGRDMSVYQNSRVRLDRDGSFSYLLLCYISMDQSVATDYRSHL